MSNLSLKAIEGNIVWQSTSRLDISPIKVKFHNLTDGRYYYRLHFIAHPDYTPQNFQEFYMYLGPYSSTSQWVYTAQFNVSNIKNMAGSNINLYSYFATPDSSTDRIYPLAKLEASTSDSFSSVIVSDESVPVYIMLGDDSSFNPTWTCPTWEDTKYDTVAGIRTLTGSNQKAVQGVSRLQFTADKAGVWAGADMDYYSVAITGGPTLKQVQDNTQTTQPAHRYFICDLSKYKSLVGNVKVVFTVEDIRGRKTTFTRTITIVPYIELTLVKNDTHRQNGIGQTVILDFEGHWHGSPLTLTCTGIVAKIAGSSSAFASLTPSPTIDGNSFTVKGNGSGGSWSGVSFASDTAYTITATFTDTVKTISFTTSIPVGTPVLSIRNKMVGINNPSPSCALDVGGEIKMDGYRVFSHVLPLSDSDIGGDLNNCTEIGFYSLSTNYALTNAPTNLVQKSNVAVIGTDDVKSQIIHYLVDNEMYVRSYYSSAWHSWKQITLT